MKKIWIAAVLLSCCLFSGCSPIVKEGAPRTEAVVGDSDHYPVTIETLNSYGEMREETFRKPPKRVVCIWQNSIENLLPFVFFCQVLYFQQCLCHVFTPFSFRLRFHF